MPAIIVTDCSQLNNRCRTNKHAEGVAAMDHASLFVIMNIIVRWHYTPYIDRRLGGMGRSARGYCCVVMLCFVCYSVYIYCQCGVGGGVVYNCCWRDCRFFDHLSIRRAKISLLFTLVSVWIG